MLNARTMISDIREHLSAVFCEATDLHEIDDGRWVLASPFTYGDGDALPVYLERHESGWSLTDDGGALARWAIDYPSYELAKPRRHRLANVVASFGAELQGETIRLDLPQGHLPDGFDMAYFLRIVAAVDVLPRIQSVRTTGFRHKVRQQVVTSVPHQSFELDYHVPRDSQKLWPFDMLLQTETDRLLTLTVSDSRQAEVATSTLQRHAEWATRGVRFIMRDISGRATDRSLARLEEVLDGAGEIVSVDASAASSVRGALRSRGVPLIPA